ncbi:MAG: T9SS type A sorting domain-containing protein, partial [Candidatus Eisenbacteria sp.]|nr:T9SS type A sorting domain-containing protein [Candidatus Eisenbacteria bacterium]
EHGEAWVDELFVGGHVQSITATPDTTFLDEPLLTGVKYYYKVAAVDTFGTEGFPSEVVAVVPGWVGIGDVDEESVAAAFFRPGSPNPFGTKTSLRYGVPSPGAAVRIRIYDVSGRRVKTLVDERQDGGVYGLAWDGRDEMGHAVASGVYFVTAEIGSWSGMRKVAVVR